MQHKKRYGLVAVLYDAVGSCGPLSLQALLNLLCIEVQMRRDAQHRIHLRATKLLTYTKHTSWQEIGAKKNSFKRPSSKHERQHEKKKNLRLHFYSPHQKIL
jgi:hypothetical protein